MGFSEEETPIARWLSEPDTGGPVSKIIMCIMYTHELVLI